MSKICRMISILHNSTQFVNLLLWGPLKGRNIIICEGTLFQYYIWWNNVLIRTYGLILGCVEVRGDEEVLRHVQHPGHHPEVAAERGRNFAAIPSSFYFPQISTFLLFSILFFSSSLLFSLLHLYSFYLSACVRGTNFLRFFILLR